MGEQKSKGEDVKISYASVKIKGEWKLWEEIEKELNKEDIGEEARGIVEKR